jgi:hypothetical protein
VTRLKRAAEVAYARKVNTQRPNDQLATRVAEMKAVARPFAEMQAQSVAELARPFAEMRARTVADIAGLSKAFQDLEFTRLAELEKPFAEMQVRTMGDLAQALGRVATTVMPEIPVDLADRVAGSSSRALARIAAIDVSGTVDEISSDLAESPGYAELWEDVQAEVEAILGGAVAGQGDPAELGAKEAASWHVSWLLFAVRSSLPQQDTVERLGTIVSYATTALIICAILRSVYPSVWSVLTDLHVTPFEALGLFGLFNLANKQLKGGD